MDRCVPLDVDVLTRALLILSQAASSNQILMSFYVFLVTDNSPLLMTKYAQRSE